MTVAGSSLRSLLIIANSLHLYCNTVLTAFPIVEKRIPGPAVERNPAAPLPYLPRVHAPAAGANLHAFLGAPIPGTPDSPCPDSQAWDLEPIESYAPWTFSDEAQEVLSIWKSCGTTPR